MKNGTSEVILEILKVSGLLAMAVLAPNAIQLLKERRPVRDLAKARRQINRSLYYLNEKKLVGYVQKNGKDYLQITEAGRKRSLALELTNIQIQKTKYWDKKWRLVIFDIPSTFRIRAETFRRKLKELGFVMLQKSVWVYPYPCEDQIEILRDIYEIRPFIRMILAERIDGTKKLREAFGL